MGLKDQLWATPGARMALVLRPTADNSGHFTFIGEAYIHGVTQGDMMKQGFLFQEITIV